MGIGLWASAVGVKYRDIGKLIPYALQLCFFVTPVAYLGTVFPEKHQWLFYLNPIAGAIDGFRWSLLGIPIDWGRVGISSLIGLFAFLYGIFYYKRMERTFADVI
jgi:lipopolysaccharide transport system permease protein